MWTHIKTRGDQSYVLSLALCVVCDIMNKCSKNLKRVRELEMNLFYINENILSFVHCLQSSSSSSSTLSSCINKHAEIRQGTSLCVCVVYICVYRRIYRAYDGDFAIHHYFIIIRYTQHYIMENNIIMQFAPFIRTCTLLYIYFNILHAHTHTLYIYIGSCRVSITYYSRIVYQNPYISVCAVNFIHIKNHLIVS